MTTGDLQRIADAVTAAGYQGVTVEYPGCIVIPGAGGYWWFGTANGYWDGDLCTADGACLGPTLRSEPALYAEEPDPATVAAVIVAALRRA